MSQGRFKPLPVGDGTGDVVAPATNSDNFIPQWDGANQKTLKNGKAAPSGTIVGTTDAQALTNKTLTAPVITAAVLGVASNAPAAADSTGAAGTVTWDADFLYVCIDTDTWVRAAIATWP